jgi:hypothetical protein
MLIRELDIRIIAEDTANSSANSPSTPAATTHPSAATGTRNGARCDDVARQVRTMSRDITECPRGDLKTLTTTLQAPYLLGNDSQPSTTVGLSVPDWG